MVYHSVLGAKALTLNALLDGRRLQLFPMPLALLLLLGMLLGGISSTTPILAQPRGAMAILATDTLLWDQLLTLTKPQLICPY